MKKVFVAALGFLAGVAVWGYDYGYKSTSYGYSNNEDKVYEGSSGQKYKYDLGNPSDKMRYELDVGAQLKDSIKMPINPKVGLDRGLGQYGGGVIDD